MYKNEKLEEKASTNWTSGFDNQFRIELSRWFKRKKFVTHLLLWSGATNGIIQLLWLQAPHIEPYLPMMLFGLLVGLFPSVGIIILMQESIVGEIKTGTASWILSKPISRESYILAKWLGNSIGATVTMIIIPSIIFHLQLLLFTDLTINYIMLIPIIIVLTLHMLLYLSFTLFMGSFQRNSALIIALPIGFYLLQQFILVIFSFTVDYIPWGLTAPLLDDTPSIVYH
ncbi:MAG: ABC transporter permease [Candidatus Hodarchaeales archaeon]|jgi:ABC-2 type transport system permease protein